jgi:adenylylsulfate kinase
VTSAAIWITGPPASGKTVLARATAAELRAAGGRPVMVLELDEIRRFVTPWPTYTETEREVVYRALVYMAFALTAAGTPVIIDATAHRRAWRDLARRLIPRFAEVQLICPLDVCREREARRAAGYAPRGIYARAGLPGSAVPGADLPYEPALQPEVTVDTRREDPATAVTRIVALIRALGELPAQAGDQPAAWAIWVTGLPGSGKTTLSRRAAAALAARSAPVHVLEFAEFRRLVLDGEPESDTTRDIVHRALVYTAKLLTDAGVPVIVDATAPRRAWRRLARELITHFAEVQLVCPHEICGERERAVRWHLGPEPPAAPAEHAPPQPDMVLGYEGSLDPELALHTDTSDLSANVEALLRLIQRLQRAAATAGHAPRHPLVS